MSYLEHFLKGTAAAAAAAGGGNPGSQRHGSVDSVEGDIEDNRAPSITSSKSNLSELSIVSIMCADLGRLGEGFDNVGRYRLDGRESESWCLFC